jgi:hypothetical protein
VFGPKKMSANHEALTEPCSNTCSQLNDFVTRRHDKVLRPLHFADMSLSQFSAELEWYLSVLDSGGSIAFCRGEKLASIRLSQRLETLFQTPTPRVLDGPQLTWTTVILAIGPRFDGSSTLRVSESLVEFAEDDLELLKSGAPWRFLNPWIKVIAQKSFNLAKLRSRRSTNLARFCIKVESSLIIFALRGVRDADAMECSLE